MRWQAALREYRRSSVEGVDMGARAPVMFVLCAECGPAGRLVAALEPAAVLQTFGGVENPDDPAIRATIEYAVRQQGVRSILVCGHTGCHARVEPTREESRATVVAQCRSLARRQDDRGPAARAPDRRAAGALRRGRGRRLPLQLRGRQADAARRRGLRPAPFDERRRPQDLRYPRRRGARRAQA